MIPLYLEPEDVLRLEEATTCLRDRLLIRLLFFLGCRVSEALAIEANDIDIAGGTVTIKYLRQRIKLSCPKCKTRLSRSHLYCPGCSRKVEAMEKEPFEYRHRRVIPLDTGTAAMIKDYLDLGGLKNRKGKVLLVCINRHRAWQIVRDCAERAGLPKLIDPESGKLHNVSPSRLRQAFGVHAVKLDESSRGLKFLQVHLGYLSRNTTARYRKMAGEEHRRWYQKLWGKSRP